MTDIGSAHKVSAIISNELRDKMLDQQNNWKVLFNSDILD